MKKKQMKSDLVVKGLLGYLSETGHTNLLPDVVSELDNLLEESKKTNLIIVTSAVLLTVSHQEQLKVTLKKLINTNLPIVNYVDKNLIGGFTVRIGDWFLDASILHQMNDIKKVLLS